MYLDIFCKLYLDHILIYNNSLQQHTKHVEIILEHLRSANLFSDMTKCEFPITEVSYLGIIILTHAIKINLAKIKRIIE